MNERLNNTRKITLSGMIIALYIVIMYFTQSFAFGQYQIRIATALYSLAYFFPFLVIPLGLANFVSNLLGGMGLPDMIGGCIVGMITSYIITLISKKNLPSFLVIVPIIIVPGFGVPIWLSYITHIPYMLLALSLNIGQIVPAVFGAVLIKVLSPVVSKLRQGGL